MPKTKPEVPEDDPGEQPESSVVEMVDIDFHGMTFTIPKYADDWDIDDLETLYRQSNVFDVVRACLGAQQFAELKAKFPKWREFKQFRDLLGEVMQNECVGL